MQGKTKGFFEDTGLILVLAGTIYGGYYLYTMFSEELSSSLNEVVKTEKIVTVTKEESKKIVDPIPKKDENPSKTIKKEEKLILVKKEDSKKITQPTPKEEKLNNTTEKKSKIEKVIPLKKEETKKEKKFTPVAKVIKSKNNSDIAMLKNFIRNLKFRIASNITKRDDLESSIPQELKIRVTVLKNGHFEELTFVSGDKKLFEINKKNIAKSFPVFIHKNIKAEFPRYIRLSIK